MTAQSPRPTPLPTDAPTPPATLLASPLVVVRRFWDACRDYVRRVWNNSAEDEIFFLAGGIAFNILLAAVPFVLLVISGLVYALGLSPDASLAEVAYILDRFLPPHAESPAPAIHGILAEVVKARDALGIWGAITFVWFSTRLFGSLGTVLGQIFDIETGRGIIAGKWFDVKMTVYSSTLLVVYMALSAYLALAGTRGSTLLMELGLRSDVMSGLAYAIGRVVAFTFIVATFWALYKYLPHRRIRWQQALVGALSSSLMFELVRNLWTSYTRSFDPGSIYSGTIYAVVSLVFWVYYAALIFIIGGEVSQAHELRRVRRLQRETLEG